MSVGITSTAEGDEVCSVVGRNFAGADSWSTSPTAAETQCSRRVSRYLRGTSCAAPPLELHVCTWNVAGIALDQFDTFIDQINDNYPWDVLLLQEGFRCTEGINVPYNHLLFTPDHVAGGLRCPAILVNQR